MAAPSTSPELDDRRERRLKVAAVVVSIVTILYGVLVAGQILLPIVLILGGFVIYLAWRFVRAHERLAMATERIADARAAGSMSQSVVSEASPRKTPRSDDGGTDGAESE